MQQHLIEAMKPYGIFGLLFLFLFLYVLYDHKTTEKKSQDTIEKQNEIIEKQNERESQYQVIIRDYQEMSKKHQDIINDYNKKELNFQNIVQQLMNQIPLKLKKDIKDIEDGLRDELKFVKNDVTSIKTTLEYEVMTKARRKD